MTKFLKDDIKTAQEVPLEILCELFPRFAQASLEVQKKSNKWVLIHTDKTVEGLEWQVATQEVVALENLIYHIFVFDTKGEFIAHIPVQAAQMLPPVSEKTHGLDYFDWLEIQGSLFKWLADNKYKVFQIDMNPEGKVVYTTKETPEEVLKKLQSNEQYGIIAIPAEKFLERLKELKDKQEAEKSVIVTPEQLGEERAKNIIVP